LQAGVKYLAELPPALIQTVRNDVLRDEGEAYARKLNSAGVDVTAVRYEGLIHDYGLLNAIARFPLCALRYIRPLWRNKPSFSEHSVPRG
jgi:acetyl esterase/lipase